MKYSEVLGLAPAPGEAVRSLGRQRRILKTERGQEYGETATRNS